MKSRWIWGAALAVASASSQAQVFGAASGYNVFTFGNFTSQYSDTEGKMAVGGNANLTGYDIGLVDPGGNAIVVGGNLSMYQGTIRGNAIVGGTGSLSSVSFANSGALSKGSPINFSAAQTSLLSSSAMWKGFGTTGTVQKPYSTLELKGSNSGMNIFNVNASQLTSASDVNILIPNGASALINLTGTGTVTLPNFGYNLNGSQTAANFRKVIWHVPDATAVNVNSLNGSLFAPKADVAGSWGAINGQMISKTFNGPTQINYQPYNGNQPVPEPATMTLVGGGLLAWIMKRRRKAA